MIIPVVIRHADAGARVTARYVLAADRSRHPGNGRMLGYHRSHIRFDVLLIGAAIAVLTHSFPSKQTSLTKAAVAGVEGTVASHPESNPITSCTTISGAISSMQGRRLHCRSRGVSAQTGQWLVRKHLDLGCPHTAGLVGPNNTTDGVPTAAAM